jgi:F-type H+-transporting ATPase subunit beta
VQLLLEHGSDREQRDSGGRNAADWARLKGHVELAARLEGEPARPGSAEAPQPADEYEDRIVTGIKAIDLLAPLARGSIVLVHGGAGVGRNVLIAELAEAARRRGDTASVWTFWQREPWSVAELGQYLNETHTSGHVRLVCHAHGDDEASARALPAQALAACEQLLASGQRHVELTLFEPGGMRASIEALLPALGPRPDGSAITAFVVPPWQSVGSADVKLAPPFDAVLAFDSALASALRFPALDVQRSRSRLLEQRPATDPSALCAREARALLAELARDSLAPDRLARALRLRAYLTQPFHVAEPFSGRPGVSVELETLLADVRAILDGRTDHLAPDALAYRGALAG